MPLFTDPRIDIIQRRLDRIEKLLEAIAEHQGVPLPPGPDVSDVRQLLSQGNKIAAIKRYREITGAGLAEAKAAVEAL